MNLMPDIKPLWQLVRDGITGKCYWGKYGSRYKATRIISSEHLGPNDPMVVMHPDGVCNHGAYFIYDPDPLHLDPLVLMACAAELQPIFSFDRIPSTHVAEYPYIRLWGDDWLGKVWYTHPVDADFADMTIRGKYREPRSPYEAKLRNNHTNRGTK